MNLILQIESMADEAADRFACGIVLLEADSDRPLHKAGYALGSQPGAGAAGFLALARGIDLALPLGPDELEIRCGSQELVDHLTGASPVTDRAVEPLYEQAVQSLLQLDSWRIHAEDRASMRAAVDLARRALDSGGDVVELDRDREEQTAAHALPVERRWTLRFLEESGPACPARCRAGTRFRFAAVVPPNLCIHAARAALEDGPANWTDLAQTSMTTLCPHCDAALRIDLD